MSAPNWIDGGYPAPHSIRNPPARNTQNGTQLRIVIEPTPEYQQFYNANRREMDRQRFEDHVTEENYLGPPKAQSMSRSTTSDSHASPSTVCSNAGDGNIPFSPNHTADATRTKPSRGRRTGPLGMETRIKTAFKRKFKLTCEFHRAKKTSCNCHDFSKLEEAYLLSLGEEGQKTKASPGRPERSLGDTFGAGGAASASISYQGFDFADLAIGHEYQPQVNANLRPVLDLDILSEASINAVRAARAETPFLPLSAPMTMPAEFAIGSKMPFRNRWECQYQPTMEETGSLVSTSPCSWTGPLEQLENHFATKHRPFQWTKTSCRSICSGCEAEGAGWNDERTCMEPEKCRPDDWKQWLFGAPVCPPRALTSGVTVSEASGSGCSWSNPPWNMATPGSSNTEQSNLPYRSYTGNSGFYQSFAIGDEKEGSSCDGANDGPYHVYEVPEKHCSCRFDAASTICPYCITDILPLLTWGGGDRCILYDPRQRLSSLCRQLALALLAPLIVFHLRALSMDSGYLTWYLVVTILGSLTIWIAMGSHITASYRDNGLHTLALML